MMTEQEEIARIEVKKLIDGKAWPLVKQLLEKHLAYKLFHAESVEARNKVVAEKDVMESFLSTLTDMANQVR